MKKKLRKLTSAWVIGAVGLLFITFTVLAAYSATITVSENGTASHDMLSCNLTMNVDYMVANGYIGPSGLDTRVRQGFTSHPHLLAEDRLVFAVPVAANSTNAYDFVTGASNLTAYAMTFGSGSSVTIADNQSIELGDNFTVMYNGWIDTDNGTDKDLLYKATSFVTYVSDTVSGNITAATLGWGSNSTETLRPDGNDTCVIPNQAGDACPDHYKNVDEVVADDAVTTVYTVNDAATYTDWYTANNTAIPASANISEVRVYIRGNTAISGWFKSGLKIGADTTYGAGHSPVVYTTFNEALTRPGGGNWQQTDLDGLLIGIQVGTGLANPSHWSYVTQVYIVVTYQLEVEVAAVTATGVASGEHSANVSAGPLLWVPGDVLKFDGTANSYVNNGAIYNNQNKYWMSFWFKLDSTWSPGQPAIKYIWGKQITNVRRAALLFHTVGSVLFIAYNDTGVLAYQFVTVQTTWTGGQWYHVIASGNQSIGGGAASDGARLRIDNGVALTSSNTTGFVNGGNFVIGANLAPSVGDGFPGAIANFVFGTDDLSAAEETALYYGTAPGDETDLWYIDEGVGTNVTSYGSAINAGTAGAATTWAHETRPCKFGISIDGTGEDGFARPTSVANTTADYVLFRNNINPYSDNITFEIDGVQRLWYEPNAIIVGTTLPDRAVGANDGVISWGSNPTGVSATIGSFVPTEVTEAVGEDLVGPDVVSDINPDEGSLFPDEHEMEGQNLPWYTTIVNVAALTNTDEQLFVWLGSAMFVMFVFTITYRYTQKLNISGSAASVALGVCAAIGLVPQFFIILAVITLIGSLISERSPSV